MTRISANLISASFLGLLLLASSANALAPNGNVARTIANTNLASKAKPTALRVGAVFEDKPHMMIGGRGYSHLLVDVSEFAQAKAAVARQKKVQAAKLLAGYTAVVCGSLLLRQMVGLLAHVPYYYKAYPLAAAMATCGLKSMVADAISQAKSWAGTWDWKRSLSGLFYGAVILGMGSKMAYSQVLPRICPPGVAGIAASCVIDNFLLAPTIWLPGAYVVKALFYRYSIREAIANYVADVRGDRLFVSYWKLWVPAQFLNFAFVPSHLQVPCMAAVGFVWYFILSSMAYKEE